MNASVRWNGKMSFVGTADSGHEVVMDAAPAVGGEDQGSRPTELVIMGLGGCTGMDVVSILEKMRIAFDEFHVDVEAERAEEHPKVFTRIHMIYRIKGENIPPDKFRRAVELSQEKYCGVSNTLNKCARLTYHMEINGTRI